MAVTEMQGSRVGVYIRDYGSTNVFQRIVCEETLTVEFNSDVQTTKTKCGTFKGVDVVDWKVNGNGVANFNPSGSEISFDDMLDLQINKTKQQIVVQNEQFTEGATTYLVGEVFKIDGPGYITGLTMTGPTNDVIKFTYNIEGIDDPTTTES